MAIRARRLAVPLVTALLAAGCGEGWPFAARAPAEAGGTSAPDARDDDGGVMDVVARALRGDDEGQPAATGPGYWRYTEPNGSLRFVQSLAEVPESARATAQHIAAAAPRDARSRAAPAAAPAGSARAPHVWSVPEEPARRTAPTVVVYTTSWCGWCRKTLAWLDERGVQYENRDIERNDQWAEELERKTGRRSIPVVDVDGRLVRGYDPRTLEELL